MRQNNERIVKLMTRPFPEESNLVEFVKLHLNELYDSYIEAENDQDYSLMDYVQGSIDTTHVYLLKSGVTPMEYEEYLELAQSNWKKV
jgi:hypothetical protein